MSDTSSTSSSPSSPSSPSSLRLRVLLVDDDSDELELLGEQLRKAGHEVSTAVDGDGALRQVEAFRPDVAVVDIGLPSMSGYELAAQIRRRAPCRLIALSGYGAATAPSDTLVSSFDAHLLKPVSIAALLSALVVETRARG